MKYLVKFNESKSQDVIDIFQDIIDDGVYVEYHDMKDTHDEIVFGFRNIDVTYLSKDSNDLLEGLIRISYDLSIRKYALDRSEDIEMFLTDRISGVPKNYLERIMNEFNVKIFNIEHRPRGPYLSLVIISISKINI
jgi:hypothetical protein